MLPLTYSRLRSCFFLRRSFLRSSLFSPSFWHFFCFHNIISEVAEELSKGMFNLLHPRFIRLEQVFDGLRLVLFQSEWLERGIEILYFGIFKASGVKVDGKLFYNSFRDIHIFFWYFWLLACNESLWSANIISIREENELEARRSLKSIFFIDLLWLRKKSAESHHTDRLGLESSNGHCIIGLHRFDKCVKYFAWPFYMLLIRI